MLEIYNGRDKFYQWDLEQKLIVDDNIIAVHYDNGTGDALVCGVYELDGVKVADVPNIMLQSCWAIKCYAYCGECVRAEKVYEVEKRSRPDDYIYTETETLRYTTLLDMLNDTKAQHNADVEAINDSVAATNEKVNENIYSINTIKEVNIPNIYTHINTLYNSQSATNEKAATNSNAIKELETDVAQNAADVAKLKTSTEYVRDVLYPNADGKISSLQTQMNAANADIAEHESRITTLENKPTGGGTGTASEVDWAENDSTSPSYIKNRTHYEAYETGTLLAEKAADMIQDIDGMMMALFAYPCLETEPILGAEYTVNYNGVEYKCIGVDGAVVDAAGSVVIGDYGLITGGISTGEPFIFILHGEKIAADEEMAIMGILLDGATELTLKIDYSGIVVHKIDNKYLDLSDYYTITQTDEKITNINTNLTNNYYTIPQVNEKFGTPYAKSLNTMSGKGISDTGVIDINGFTDINVDIALQGKQIMDTLKLKMYDSSNTYICDMAIAENMTGSDIVSIQVYYRATGLLNIDVEVGSNSAVLKDVKRYVWKRTTTVGTLGTLQLYTANGTTFGDNASITFRGVKA